MPKQDRNYSISSIIIDIYSSTFFLPLLSLVYRSTRATYFKYLSFTVLPHAYLDYGKKKLLYLKKVVHSTFLCGHFPHQELVIRFSLFRNAWSSRPDVYRSTVNPAHSAFDFLPRNKIWSKLVNILPNNKSISTNQLFCQQIVLGQFWPNKSCSEVKNQTWKSVLNWIDR